ncbi:MAG: AtpZ/AtpI family protein [Phycisphaerae bacterium]|jgi:F0F1-type ATP synthase assembly protein I
MPNKAKYSNLIQFSSVGLEFIITFGLLLAGGAWLDKRLGSSPAFTLAGGALGFIGAMIRLVRKGREMQNVGRKDDQENRPGPQS